MSLLADAARAFAPQTDTARAWRRQARPDQLPPAAWGRTWYIRGGRGAGKTWTAAHAFAELIEATPTDGDGIPTEWAVVAETFGKARDICIEGRSGLLRALGLPRLYPGWNRSQGQLRLPTGQVVFIGGGDDGAGHVQGKDLSGVWADEIGRWARWSLAWDESIRYAVRQTGARIIATGTPKRGMPAMALVKRLLADPKVVSTRLRTLDNASNLDPTMLAEVAQYAGTALGRQELEGEVLDEAEGALWTRDPDRALRDSLGLLRYEHPDDLRHELLGRTVVALDPSDGAAGGDGVGFVVAARHLDHMARVLHSDDLLGERAIGPTAQVREARRLYDLHGADTVVVEKNHGGAWLVDLFRTVDPSLPVRVVNATQGKRTRAEPVAALYTRPGVVHVGDHTMLEDQMTSYTGAPGEQSPNALDALVWALTALQPRQPVDLQSVAHVQGWQDAPTDAPGFAVSWA